MYEVTILVTWDYGGGSTTTQSWLTKLMVVNETGSPLGRGWTLAGVQRVFPQDSGHVLLAEGDGSAIFFRKAAVEIRFEGKRYLVVPQAAILVLVRDELPI